MIVSTQTWLEAQMSVLGSCLIDDRVTNKIVFGLQETDFCESYRAIYRALRDLYTTGKAVDPVTVMHVVGGEYRDTIIGMMEATPTAAHIDRYIEIVKSQSLVFQLRAIGDQLAICDNAEEGRQLAEKAQKLNIHDESDTWNLSQGFDDFFKRYRREPEYFSWFIPEFRKILRAAPGDYYILGARPSVGKSAFAIQAVLFWAVYSRKRVAFFSHETSREKVMDRLIAAAVHIPLEALQERRLSDADLEKVRIMAGRIKDAPLDIVSSAGQSVQDIEQRALHRRYEIIVIDYLQITKGQGKSEYEIVSNISKDLHIMCQEHRIFCLALSQLDRLKGARPTLEDLRSSGQLEQDADAVIFLHRLAEPGEPRELIIAKNKDGKTAPTRLAFDGNCQQFCYLGSRQNPLMAIDYSKPLPKKIRESEEEDTDQYTIIEGDDPNNPFCE